ncbi:hypothetical protein PN499_22065 [Kamptonema animale CS-326]|jgi:hypothetical protein|uniref:hypothetical protein n=1 Tax=Kamptonema animale TaxID=92934 RepID=UPI00232C739E|nr:hypothetical protein [Kamptonema animale]MDB9513889.1 hypothetical protein [Kamptonema animale CS-326]
MPTEFKNKKILEDGSMGYITTVTDLKVWDCKEKRWLLGSPVIIRNAMLFALYPLRGFCIGQISKEEKNPAMLNPFVTPGNPSPYRLDLASNSRNHGRFTFIENYTIGQNYFGQLPSEQWKRIIYGSILHTGTKRMSYKVIKYIVVDDELRDANGNYRDDPVNNKHWNSGDSHAKASAELMQLIGLPAIAQPDLPGSNPGDEIGEGVDVQKPVQFRAADFGKWVAKGTIGYNPDLDGSGYDLVIPLSSLKGNKPALGNYESKLLIGVVFEAEERRAKAGWMLFQWFDFKTLQDDLIISRLIQKCEKLAIAYNSIKDLAEILRIDQEEVEQEQARSINSDAGLEGESKDELQSEAEYVNLMVRIIKADKHGRLLLHPWLVHQVSMRLQKVWLNLAKAAGVRFHSVMCMPDESLAHYHTVLPDGRIEGRKVFCAPDFAEGEYIIFCNPMRHWGDVQLWENKHEGAFVGSTGYMTAPRLLLLNLGRDTDGDFIQLIRSSAYPAMRDAIAAFEQSPIVKKFPKMALKGSLQQVAINSMNDITGIVSSLMGKARSARAENIVLMIPAGGAQKTPVEMKIIDFLSQELQIAVDSIKSAYPNNKPGLDAVQAFLSSQGAEIPWLGDLKHPDCYKKRPCLVKPDAEDTVSRIIKLVNSYWKSPDLQVDSDPATYKMALFTHVQVEPEQENYITAIKDNYNSEMGTAIAWAEEHQGDTSKIKEVAQAFKALLPTIYNYPKPGGGIYTPRSWAAAAWRAAHSIKEGRAGFVFTMFPDEIIEDLLRVNPEPLKFIICYGVQYGKWTLPRTRPWSGQTVQIRAYYKVLNNKQYFSLEMKYPDATKQTGWEHLGIIHDKHKPFVTPSETRTMLIHSRRFGGNPEVTTEVVLFDPNLMTDEEMLDYLNYAK